MILNEPTQKGHDSYCNKYTQYRSYSNLSWKARTQNELYMKIFFTLYINKYKHHSRAPVTHSILYKKAIYRSPTPKFLGQTQSMWLGYRTKQNLLIFQSLGNICIFSQLLVLVCAEGLKVSSDWLIVFSFACSTSKCQYQCLCSYDYHLWASTLNHFHWGPVYVQDQSAGL